MFAIKPPSPFPRKVRLTVPGQEALGEIELMYHHMDIDALQEFSAQSAERSEEETIRRIVAGWNDADAEYNPENLRALLKNHPSAAGEIFQDYVKALTESRVKN